MGRRLFAALALAVTVLGAGEALVAQALAPDAAQSLLQLELKPIPGQSQADGRTQAEAFIAATRTITSCEKAVAVGKAFKSGFTLVAAVPLDSFRRHCVSRCCPDPGRASAPFGKWGDPIRVLVICPPAFVLPGGLLSEPAPAS